MRLELRCSQRYGGGHMITEEDLRRFRDLYKEHFGVSLSESEAQQEAQRLLNLGRTIRAYRSSKTNGGNRSP